MEKNIDTILKWIMLACFLLAMGGLMAYGSTSNFGNVNVNNNLSLGNSSRPLVMEVYDDGANVIMNLLRPMNINATVTVPELNVSGMSGANSTNVCVDPLGTLYRC